MSLMMILLLGSVAASRGDVQEYAEMVNDTIEHAEVVKIVPPLSKLLAVDEPQSQKALVESNFKLSDVALAKLVSQKSGKPFDTILTPESVADWLPVLKANDVSETEAETYLDNFQSEVALIMFDYREKRWK